MLLMTYILINSSLQSLSLLYLQGSIILFSTTFKLEMVILNFLNACDFLDAFYSLESNQHSKYIFFCHPFSDVFPT